jgi:hypothetical protein
MKSTGATRSGDGDGDTGPVAIRPGAFGLSARDGRMVEAIAAQVLQLLLRSGPLPGAERLPPRRGKEMPS